MSNVGVSTKMANRTIDFVRVNNFDGIGQDFITSAILLLIEKKFEQAYEFITRGLSLVTCDCEVRGQLQYIDSRKIFDEVDTVIKISVDYLFCKAFILSFSNEKRLKYVALDCIEIYLANRKDRFGYYMQGVLFVRLGDYQLGLSSFYKSYALSNDEKILYKIGRVKAEITNEDGLAELYKAFMSNPKSVCCAYALSKCLRSQKVSLIPANEEVNNIFISYFSANPEAFVKEFSRQMVYEQKNLGYDYFIDLLSRMYFMFIDQLHFISDEIDCIRQYEEADDYEGMEDYFDDRDDYYDNWRPDRENPWRDLMTDEEADTAYWNTD